ncbi:M28 family metallopeptidase [Gelidibacter maritimus]|uniref:M20/M25/M40 family metallo-hydrolase n=1 Tax=Gelidibacter maritimus TaxID=2761487 RepID=A0A7W2M8B2_9FLAO|nr:M20/M25/M40 family metallo-hydrolase [Gelidibacter maritimus]MBA6154518.1 M20/M25/M40 family metallo-hydrolase [Gelidibacter maritimus]
MKNILLIGTLLIMVSCKNQSQKTTQNSNNDLAVVEIESAIEPLNFVTSAELKETVYYLASDELKGRATGSDGIEKAAVYIEDKFKSYNVAPYFETYRDHYKAKGMDASNVVGYIEGNDPELKKEFIILGAHYDHIGVVKAVDGDSIANGANDDASGVAAVLAMARYFADKKNNKRSILFTLYSGEEIGLLGSKHLAERLQEDNINLYTMTNFEMMGVPMVDKDYEAYFTGFDLSNMAVKMNDYVNFKLLDQLPQAKEFQLFYRSDNYPFFKVFNKPSHAVSTFDFTNFDHYHKVGDEAELMNYEFMADLVNKLIPAYEAMSNTTTQEIQMYE